MRRKQISLSTLQRVAIILLSTCLAACAYGQAIGVGAMGDSFTDEYDIFTPWPYQGEGKNWIEQLVLTRSSEMDFGEYSATSRGAPRYAGYSHNWARSGATSSTLQSEGQHSGLAEQIVNGDVSLVFLGIGANDFSSGQYGTVQLPGFGPFAVNLTNEYGPIYYGQRTDQQVDDRVNNLVNNFRTVLDAMDSAGASVVIGTAIDFGSVPAGRAAYPDATRRQRITDALLAANTQITDIALSRGMPVVDLAALLNLYYSSTPVLVGGINTKSGGRFFLGDGVHPSTLIQGLLANAFIAAANEAFGTDFTPLSAAEILMNAGISPPNPLGDTFDVTTLVRLPSAVMLPGDYNRDGIVDAADYVVWRHGLGTTYTPADYDAWRANFGQTIGSGAIELVSRLPEPSTESALAIGVLVLAACCRITSLRLRTFRALITRRRFNQFVLPRWRTTNGSPRYVALLILCSISCDCLAQTGDPFLPGEYRVGYQELAAFDAARDHRPVTTLIWYPADADVTEGAPIRYARPLWGWTQQSPFLGGLMDVPVDDAGPFPLVVLSHGDAGLPQEFELLGEVLASHGYVVAAPQHAGNSAVTTNLPGMGSHRPADISFVIDTMLARSATPGDLLSGAINANAVAVGGFSRGAATATATVSGRLARNATEFDVPPDPRVKALVLIDGTPNTVDTLTPELRATVRVPTLSIGGSVGNFPANSNELRVAGPMYGVDAINAAHADFIVSCRFLNSLLESNAPQQVLNFFGVRGPIECGPDLLPSGEVVEIVARHTTAFLDSQLGNDHTNEDSLRPSRQELAGSITLRASVLGAGAASEWADLVLTDPSGRRIGVDPQTGESFSDFTAQEIRYVNGQSSRAFSISADAVSAGDYTLTAHGNASISEPRTLRVTLELMEQRQRSRVFEREILLSELIDAGIAIDPLRFEIVPVAVPESGDFNQDGTVDAADYVVWREGLGTTYTQDDYDLWRANFGQTAGGGAALPFPDPLSNAIPEPATLTLLIMAIVVHYPRRRSTVS